MVKSYEQREYSPGGLGMLGGFCVLGDIVTAPTIVVGELAERAGLVDSFPGGLLGKIAVGLCVAAAGLISVDSISQKG